MNRQVFILLTILSLPCFGQQKEIAVLFAGNSLTYTNDLPGQVAAIAKEKGIKLRVKMLAFPNYALEDHWNDGALQKLIRLKKFDMVIVQQGPSSQQEGREMLLEYGKMISALCAENNALLAFFMVWPSRQHYATFDDVIKNYRDASEACQALLFPVGEQWKEYIDKTHDYSYYGTDSFHPSSKGTALAASVIAEIIVSKVRNR